MQDRNIANIFFQQTAGAAKHSDGILVGYNFEGFTFVIVAIVPFSQFKDLESLAQIL